MAASHLILRGSGVCVDPIFTLPIATSEWQCKVFGCNLEPP